MRCTLDQLAAQQLLVSAGLRHVLEALFVLRQHRCSQLGCDLSPEAFLDIQKDHAFLWELSYFEWQAWRKSDVRA